MTTWLLMKEYSHYRRLQTNKQELKFNEEYKQKAKEYTDRTNNRRESSLKEGDVVLMKNLRPRKADPVYFDKNFTVIRRNGNQVELETDGGGKTYRRPLSHLKKVPGTVSIDCDKDLHLKPKIDYEKFRSNVLKEADCNDDPVIVNAESDNVVADQSMSFEPVRRGYRVTTPFKTWQHPG